MWSELYGALNILYCSISLTILIKKEVKFQSYILSYTIGKQYLKTAVKVSIKTLELFHKVNFLIIIIFSIRRNIIVPSMNITFFNDTRNVILKFIFEGEGPLCLFDRRRISYLQERETLSLPNIQIISNFHVFFGKKHLSFSV